MKNTQQEKVGFCGGNTCPFCGERYDNVLYHLKVCKGGLPPIKSAEEILKEISIEKETGVVAVPPTDKSVGIPAARL